MKVRGIDNLTLGELIALVKNGGRFVVYHWAASFALGTSIRPSPVFFVRKDQRSPWRRSRYVLASLLCGWWSPWGPGKTIRCVKEVFRGGCDVTAKVLQSLARAESVEISSPLAMPPAREPVSSHAA